MEALMKGMPGEKWDIWLLSRTPRSRPGPGPGIPLALLTWQRPPATSASFLWPSKSFSAPSLHLPLRGPASSHSISAASLRSRRSRRWSLVCWVSKPAHHPDESYAEYPHVLGGIRGPPHVTGEVCYPSLPYLEVVVLIFFLFHAIT